MKLLYNRQHLVDMLSADHLSREDKSAVRFALWCINNRGLIQSESPHGGDVPYWRYVEYADDGCSIYQCLDCKEKWEARTSPGWVEYHDRIDGRGPKGGGVLDVAEDTYYHYVEKDEPVYHPVFTYCPYCGIEWDGPIRRDDDNENMWGDKRLARRNKQTEARKQFTPPYWYVIQTKRDTFGKGISLRGKWKDVVKLSPLRHTVTDAHKGLNDVRDQQRARQLGNPFKVNDVYHARVVVRNQKAMKELYPIAFQGLDEVR